MASAGDPCCFCGEPLVSDGGRVFCISRVDDCVCIGRIKEQEPMPSPEELARYKAVGRAILDSLEDRRGIKRVFYDLQRSDPFVYKRLEWELGKVACEADIAPRRAA